VAYPYPSGQGLLGVKTAFNPQINFGAQVEVKSSIKPANGRLDRLQPRARHRGGDAGRAVVHGDRRHATGLPGGALMEIRGQQETTDGGSDFNAQVFLVRQMLGRVSTATLVKVAACSNNGGLSPVGTVDVIPLVNQVDGAGNAVPHGTVYGLPYFRLQGGANAIIIDPQPGDIGVAVFASHDLSSVKATKDQANPGSWRRFDMADGLYFGGMLNGVPNQYIQFNAGGINVISPGTVVVNAGGDVNVTAAGHVAVTAGSDASVHAGGNVDVTAGGTAHVAAPAGATIDANTTVNGSFRVNGGTTLNGPLTQVSGGGGGTTATLIGPLTVTNDVVAQGTSVHTHTHGGVTSGSGNTAGPN
jgi:hypothetical protein